MNILIVERGVIPVKLYGGTERVIWDLGKALSQLGHKVTYLVGEGSTCPFGKIIPINKELPIEAQIPNNIDVIHFHCGFDASKVNKPYVYTMHGNAFSPSKMYVNSIFVSKNHAERHQSLCYVNNGLDWDNYSSFNPNTKKTYFHFLGKASWNVKNVKGVFKIIKHTKNERVKILGGKKKIKYGLINNIHPRISFEGFVGGDTKNQLLNKSKGLIFPVRWHEPFGLAIIESLYYGGAVFGTKYGSLPDLVIPEVGFLSNNAKEISDKIENDFSFNPKICNEYAIDTFNHLIMAEKYLLYYEQVLNGEQLNKTAPILKSNDDSKLLAWE